jgi:hypothetical protein
MTAVKDWTPEAARQWVAQELAKASKTPGAIASRIAAEEQVLAWIKTRSGPDFPSSEWAHEELLRQLAPSNPGP